MRRCARSSRRLAPSAGVRAAFPTSCRVHSATGSNFRDSVNFCINRRTAGKRGYTRTPRMETRGPAHESTPHRRDTADDHAVPEGRRDRLQARSAPGRLADRRRQPWHGGRRFDRRGAYARSRRISRADGGHGGGCQRPRTRDCRHHRRFHPRCDPARQAGARHERRRTSGDAGALSVQAGRTGDGRSLPPHGRRNRHARSSSTTWCRGPISRRRF